jgi:hypothetical protein
MSGTGLQRDRSGEGILHLYRELWRHSGGLRHRLAAGMLHGPGRILKRNVALEVRRRVAANLTEKLLTLPLQWHEAHQSGVPAHRVQQSTRRCAPLRRVSSSI